MWRPHTFETQFAVFLQEWNTWECAFLQGISFRMMQASCRLILTATLMRILVTAGDQAGNSHWGGPSADLSTFWLILAYVELVLTGLDCLDHLFVVNRLDIWIVYVIYQTIVTVSFESQIVHSKSVASMHSVIGSMHGSHSHWQLLLSLGN